MGVLTLSSSAVAADRRPADATRIDPNYWPQSSDRVGKDQGDGSGSNYRADYHADYSMRRADPAARDTDGRRNLWQDRPASGDPERYMRPQFGRFR